MADPQYPNVPIAPGVPPVYRSSGLDANGIPITEGPEETVVAPLKADAANVTVQSSAAWGIYTATGGVLALAVDSIVAVEPGREFRISDYNTEEGGFQSFNKVATPAETRVTVAKGGNATERQAFLAAIDTMVAALDIYSIVMPDQTLTNRNLTHYTYARTAEKGVQLLVIDLHFEEVRQSATAAFTDSQQPSGTDPSQTGPVQPTTPTQAQSPVPVPITADQPALEAIGPITPDMTQAQRAAATTSMITAGASIGQLATLGVSFLAVPTIGSPSQSLTAYLGGQSVRLDISQRDVGLFCDVYANSKLIIGGVPIENDNAIVRSAYLGFPGDLFFHDTQGGIDNIGFTDLASRVALLYAGA